ncbi:molybdopterin-dependent oxidoreductase [Rhodococcus coprophilus]|uniref:Oxidoreductase n=1 Tax=Rhodococcus coprophilus TaxID=38310 RepID=A0A2X4TUY5_9NOCA|nr:molybdopterin-dependent oxidoreductase [Rhodococcus coprophilus]MBM7457969.1 anaerobic selenocysteine-containing dehydrogenase [Rhodococcus coprophilus]SQI30811.1 oxidoreductase [Rhodococcus coprophilus]
MTAEKTAVSTHTVARQCTLCEAHCGILVTVDHDRVTRIEGDPDDVLSHGYICPKATALADLHHDPDRLRRPMRRVGDSFEEIDWDEAFALAGSRLRAVQRRHGRDAVAMYLGNPAAHSSSVLYGIALRVALLTRKFYSASSIDQFPQEFAAWKMFGSNVLMPIADVDRTDRLLILGANPAVSNGSVTTMPDARGRIAAIRRRGGSVVVVDPRRTETARLADEHVAVRPGGDPYLLLGMLHTIFADGIHQKPATVPLTGMDHLAELVAACTPEEMAPRAGVDADTIRRLARDHNSARSAVAYARIGVCHQVTGTLTHWLVNTLNAVTGNLDRPGGQMFSSPPIDVARLMRRLGSGYGMWSSRTGEYKSFRTELPVVGMADEMLGDAQGSVGPVRALVTYAGNPVLSTPQGGRLDEALDSLDFFVAVDMYLTETSRHADLILPPVSHLEREEFDFLFPVFSVRNNARFSARVFEPAADALEDWQIMSRLTLEVLPLPFRTWSARPVRALLDRLSPLRLGALGVLTGPHGVLRRGRRGLTLGRIRRARGGIDLGPLQPRLRSLVSTRDRRVHVAPPEFVDETRRLAADAEIDYRDEEFDLRLIGRRHLRSNNSWLHNIPTMVKGRDRCTVLMHPDDAASRSLVHGQPVTVRSRIGSIVVPVEVSDEIRAGTVAVPHGWGHDEKGVGWFTAAAHPGANVNLLHDPAVTDTFTGNAAVNATMVNVAAKASAAIS